MSFRPGPVVHFTVTEAAPRTPPGTPAWRSEILYGPSASEAILSLLRRLDRAADAVALRFDAPTEAAVLGDVGGRFQILAYASGLEEVLFGSTLRGLATRGWRPAAAGMEPRR